MMKKLLVVLMAVLLFMPGLAQARRQFGLGIIIGYPLGLSGKLWLNNRNAFDAALSVVSRDEVYLHGTYLWHDYTAFPKPEEGQLPLYYGVGAVVTSKHLGARGAFGIEYLFSGYPFDLFMELAPVLYLIPEFNLGFTGGIGGRYYFGGSGSGGRHRTR